MKQLFIAIAFICLSLPGFANTPNAADRIQNFNNELNLAYADYRIALFQTNKNAQQQSLKATQSFQRQWNQIIKRYLEDPPANYATDPEWKASLGQIKTNIEISLDQIQNNSLAEAHETLEAIRDILGETRRRNNIISFSDFINEYHEKMEEILKMKVTEASGLRELSNHLAVLEYLAKTLKSHAPESYVSDKKFQQLMMDNETAIKNLRQAVNKESVSDISKNLKALKPAYAKLFVQFG